MSLLNETKSWWKKYYKSLGYKQRLIMQKLSENLDENVEQIKKIHTLNDKEVYDLLIQCYPYYRNISADKIVDPWTYYSENNYTIDTNIKCLCHTDVKSVGRTIIKH